MKLPEAIPKRLRDAALFLPDFEDGEGAWTRADALRVIDSIKATTVPICEVRIFSRSPWGYAPSDSALSIDRLPSESDVDYGVRSRHAAAEFIRQLELGEDDILVALTFPLWKEAA